MSDCIKMVKRAVAFSEKLEQMKFNSKEEAEAENDSIDKYEDRLKSWKKRRNFLWDTVLPKWHFPNPLW